MIVEHAKALAKDWVSEEAMRTPGFQGAFFHGSTNWLPDDAELPATSDLDVMVVVAGASPPEKPGKFIYRDQLLEVSYLVGDQLGSAEEILGQYHLAGSFAGPSVIADPSGRLTALQRAVSRDYAKRRWVWKRCEHARERILHNLALLDQADPFHDQVTAWLFATGVTTHVLLVAGLKNPTVRRRYVATRELLADYGCLALHESLLELLGCARMSRERAERHLATLAGVFDVAKTVVRTPFFFAADMSDLARPVAIDGSREMIARGDHREAIFWMVATYARCLKVFHHDAPDLTERFDPGFRELLADVGITSFADLRQRGDQVEAFLPRLWNVAEVIMAANPEIED